MHQGSTATAERLPRMRRTDRSLFGRTVEHAGSQMDLFDPANRPESLPEPVNDNSVKDHSRGALLVCHKLLGGVSAINVAGEENDARTFAIGAMAANMIARDLLEEWARHPAALFKIMEPVMSETIPLQPEEGLSLRRPSWLGRSIYINRLNAVGALRPGATIRQVKPSQSTPSPREVCQLVAENSRNLTQDKIRVSHDEIISAGRSHQITRTRFIATWLMREVCGMSLSAIGQYLGGRDHSTVLNALSRMAAARDGDEGKRVVYDALLIEADEIGIERHHRILASQYRPGPKLLTAPRLAAVA